MSRGLGVMLKARKLLSLNAMKTLYFSFVYPYFTYCNHVWGTAYDTHLYPLFMQQKRAVRIITMSKYREHTDPLFLKLGLLKIHDINTYVFSKFLYRWYHDKLPSLFENIFTHVGDVHHFDTRQCTQQYCPRIKTNLGKCKFSYRAPHIWNQFMRAKINPDTSEAIFCRSIKQCIKVGILKPLYTE